MTGSPELGEGGLSSTVKALVEARGKFEKVVVN